MDSKYSNDYRDDIDDGMSEIQVKPAVPDTHWFMCVLITINAAIGAGILTFPYAFNTAGGIPVAVAMQIVFAILATISLIMLAYCADKTHTTTLQEVIQACLGKVLYIICTVCIAVHAFAACITYLIVIGDQWQKVFQAVFPNSEQCCPWYVDRRFIVPITALVITYPLCIPNKIDFLRIPSALGVLGVVYVVLMIIIEYLVGLPNVLKGEIKTMPENFFSIFLAIPPFCFAFLCHLSSVPVYASMRGRPDLRRYTLVASMAIVGAFLSYVVVGVCGYLTFGSNVKSDIFLSYPPQIEVLVGIALFSINPYTTYPILHFVGRATVQNIVVTLKGISDDQWSRYKRKWNIGFATGWFILTTALAIFIPDLGMVIGFLGCLAALFVFVIPGACMAKLIWDIRETQTSRAFICKFILSIFFIIFGVIAFVSSITESIINLTKGSSGGH